MGCGPVPQAAHIPIRESICPIVSIIMKSQCEWPWRRASINRTPPNPRPRKLSLDLARAEPGDDVPWRKCGAGSGCDPPRSFPPRSGARSGASGSRRPGTDRKGSAAQNDRQRYIASGAIAAAQGAGRMGRTGQEGPPQRGWQTTKGDHLPHSGHSGTRSRLHSSQEHQT
jgi:hypothetical protein